ncbi:hypothetical protein ACFVT9_00835 [Kitasatospora cineracea]|uniref:hypothetical protein n=1 Tax=Kitasatospora cineracea TaxID=88074 RepID=UPI0036D835E9
MTHHGLPCAPPAVIPGYDGGPYRHRPELLDEHLFRVGHLLHVVCRAFAEDEGIDYLLHHPGWAAAEPPAGDEGCFSGPGLCWDELVAAVDNGLPGGSTADPHARLLLLLPAFGDADAPAGAVERLAAALRARARFAEPERLAAALPAVQGPCGAPR